VSFKNTASIPKNNFEWIEEWHVTEDRKYLVGVISQKKLKNTDWWRTNDVSLILCPDAIIEDIDIREIKKRSLELAGILN
jgi:homoserine dehydrogenase